MKKTVLSALFHMMQQSSSSLELELDEESLLSLASSAKLLYLENEKVSLKRFYSLVQSEYSRVNHCGILGSQIGISFPQPGIPGTKKSQSSFGCFTSFFPFTLVIIEILFNKGSSESWTYELLTTELQDN